ncbi:hypothetical protein HDU79_005277 [Rhizoclosmatium sp. JEL0117]|nr:hypothetical protein HDU79_005277 [Rhizoclosmatium sp. JEL0117]
MSSPGVATLLGFLSCAVLDPIFGLIPLCCIGDDKQFKGYFLRGFSICTILYSIFFFAWAPIFQNRCNDIGTSYSFLKDHPDITKNDVYDACRTYLIFGLVLGSIFLIIAGIAFAQSRKLIAASQASLGYSRAPVGPAAPLAPMPQYQNNPGYIPIGSDAEKQPINH